MKFLSYCSFIFVLFPCVLWGADFSTEARVGYFYPTSHHTREVYGSGGAEFELEQSARVYKNLHAWLNLNYYHRKGSFQIRTYPLSLGLKYNIRLRKDLCLYLGGGVSYSWIRFRDESRHTANNAFGGVFKSGLLYYVGCNCFVDLFADYYYTRIHRNDIEASQNVGGLRTGIGLGIAY